MTHIWQVSDKKEEQFLRTKVSHFAFTKNEEKELRALQQTMRVVMKEAQGIGLSANQIGIAKRIFVAQVPDKNGRMKWYTVLNPEIIKQSKQMVDMEEGCLSVPEVFGSVTRPFAITIEGHNLQGKKIKIEAQGLLARVFQHEIDHLNGGLFIDKCKDLKPHPRVHAKQ